MASAVIHKEKLFLSKSKIFVIFFFFFFFFFFFLCKSRRIKIFILSFIVQIKALDGQWRKQTTTLYTNP